MIDHPDQLPCAAQIAQEAGHPPLVFLKLDTGYGRAGLPPASPAFAALVDAVLAAEAGGALRLHGLYSHAGHSYDCRDVWDPMSLLASEFAGLQQAAEVLRRKEPAAAAHPLVLTVGATPTTTTIQHPDLLGPGRARAGAPDQAPAPPTHTIAAQFAALRTAGFALEVHAGVYPTLDLQQLATHARDARLLAAADVAISVVAEVASVYAGRGAAGTAEALVNAGSLALGREPVKDAAAAAGHYAGWGVVMPWAGLRNEVPGERFPRRYGGLCVGKISQEHGILAWGGAKEDEPVLAVGQRVRIWPNHACVAGAGFDHYLIVDSRNTDKEDVVVDVWSRWQGW